MITTNIQMADTFQPAVGMPACASAFVRVEGTTVSACRGTTDVLVIKGAFPGTSAWSPPI